MENFNALYYQKPYIRAFDATVTACLKTERGYEIELSDTAFAETEEEKIKSVRDLYYVAAPH